MKILAIISLLAALFLLYRIAYQKPIPTPKNKEDFPEKEPETNSDIVGKSHFVRSTKSQSTPNDDSLLKAKNQTEKANIFASETIKNDAIIPPEELDEVFEDTSDLDIEPDDETNEIDMEEEAEELRQILGNDALPASGLTYEEMAEAINNPSDEKAEMLCQMEQTDLFEQLVSNNESKALRIKAVIDRHVQTVHSENEVDNNDYGNFDIADFLT